MKKKLFVWLWLTKNNIHYQLRLIQSLPPSTPTETPQASEPEKDSQTKTINNCVTTTENETITIATGNIVVNNNILNNISPQDSSPSQKGGRPKGSTHEKKLDDLKRDSEAKIVATKLFMKIKKEKGKVNSNDFKNILKKVRDDFDLPNFFMKRSTIISRIRRGNPSKNQMGPVSPMAVVEPLLCDVCIQKSKMGQPMNQTEGLLFANSIIQDSETQRKLIAFQQKLGTKKIHLGVLSKKYWSSFLKRNNERIESEIGCKQAACRKEWSTYQNFEAICNLIYPQMVESGIAERLETPVWMDGNGNIVGENDALGKMVDYLLKHPEYLVFVDEVGNNANMKEDGRVGGEKKIGAKGERAQQTVASNDAHFTVLGFTAGTGEPTMCAVTFKAAEVTTQMQMGVDITIDPTGTRLEDNTGKNKRCPGGPVCRFKGKDVPAFACCSPSGGINSELLTQMLQHMDKLGLFPRKEGGPKPFLLLDGHGSRFQLPFLKCVNNPSTQWCVCIGVPNGTAYWQVGDSNEQNGSWKIYMTKAKNGLVQYKIRMGMNVALTRNDIIPIVNVAWQQSFGRVRTNKLAISVRGWGPLNRALLLHPETLKTKPETITVESDNESEQQQQSPQTSTKSGSISTESSPCDSLNVSTGYSSVVLTDILQHQIKAKSIHENLKKRYSEGKKARDVLKEEGKRFSAGLMFKSGRVRLDEEICKLQEDKWNKSVSEEAEKKKKQRERLIKRKEAHDKVLALNKSINTLNKTQLKSLVSWKKRPGDKAIPDTIPELIKRHEETYLRDDPLIPSIESEPKEELKELDVEEEDNELQIDEEGELVVHSI